MSDSNWPGIVLVALSILSFSALAPVCARGGGGGSHGGGFGESFGGGDRFGGGTAFGGGESFGGSESFGGGEGFGGYRDGAGWGGNGYGWSRGRDDYGYGSGYGAQSYRPFGGQQQAAVPRPSEQELRAGAATNYSWGDSRSALSTDGALGRIAASNGAVGETTRAISPAVMADNAASVRANYGYRDVFDRTFWADHNAWADAAAWGDYWAWGYAGWPELADWWSVPVSAAPQDYDYGNNITYQNDMVYYGSQPVESTVTYYDQAQTLAQSVPVTAAQSSNKSDWKPLGVFSLVQGSQTNTTSMFQLAVNKQGAIKGTYYNVLTQDTSPVTGAVDKKNMRVSWIVGGNKNVVYDTGLNNLLQPQSPLLLHYSKSKTQQWTLVRLSQPASGSAGESAAAPAGQSK